MAIHVRYFASLRDRLGRAGDELDTPAGLTVAGVWAALHSETPLPPNTLAAVNLEYAERTQVVRDGDEVAFFPPVTGGQGMWIELRDRPFAPLAELAEYQNGLDKRLAGQYGAAAIFIGTMRDFNDGDAVQSMTLEHYPGMTERQLQHIVATAGEQSPLLDTLVIHRVGVLQPNDPIVLVAVWSAHRAAAFAACRFIMEELKLKAPFWKREEVATGSRWVEHNTEGFSESATPQ